MPSGKELVFTLIGIDKAGPAFKHMGSEVEKAGGKFSKFKVAGGLALVAVAGAAVELGKKSVDAFEETGKEALALQRVMGGTAESASRLNFAAHETGISSDVLSRAMAKLAKFTSTAGDQTEGFQDKLKAAEADHKKFSGTLGMNAAALDNLGVKFLDAKGKAEPLNQTLLQLATKFQQMPNGTEKTALAMQVFGKSGKDLLPFLNRGAAGLKDLGIESDKLGHTLSGAQLDAVKKNIAAHREFSAAVSGVEIQIGAQLYPALNKIVPAVAAFAATVAEKAIPKIQEFGHWMSDKLGPALSKAYKQILPGVRSALESLSGSLSKSGVKWAQVGNAVIGFIGVASKIIAVVLPAMIRLWGLQITVVRRVVQAVNLFESVSRTVFATVTKVFLGMVGAVIDGAAKAFGWIKGIGGPLKRAAAAFDNFRNQVNASLAGIHNKTVTVYAKVTGPGAHALALAQAHGHGGTGTADGVSNFAGGLTEINEHGREFIDLPRGSNVHTATAAARMTKQAPTPITIVGQVFTAPMVIKLLQDFSRATGKPIQIKTA